jgi:rsbT co-antagonist protein RsbR
MIEDLRVDAKTLKWKGVGMAAKENKTSEVLRKYEAELLEDWQKELAAAKFDSRITASELQTEAREFMTLLQKAAAAGSLTDLDAPAWTPVKDFLENLSRSRAVQGFTSEQTARFIFSFKRPFFSRLQKELAKDTQTLEAEMWTANDAIDQLGLHTVKTFQKSREEIIGRQQQEMLELSTPVVKLWEGILALPMIGTLDSARTQVVMESLLQRIVETGSEIAIIDITGVPTVDTLVAQHLLKTVTAIRLMGADCIISGIRPQIAQTIVHLGVDLQGVITKATLADALTMALKRSGFTVSKSKV